MRIQRAIALFPLLLSCGGGGSGGDSVPELSTFEGTYDARVEFTDSFRPNPRTETREMIGLVRIGGDETLTLGLSAGLWGVTLSGVPAADGRVALEGLQFVGDVAAMVRGTGRLSERDGVLRVTGTFDGFLEGDTTLDMTRPIEGVALEPDGAWTIDFTPSPTGCDCSSTVRVALRTSPDGSCSVTDAFEHERGAPERLLVLLSEAGCRLSPAGRVQIRFHWRGCGARPETLCTVTLGGTLEEGANEFVGTGEFDAHDPIPGFFNVYGSWTAARVDDAPGRCGNGIVEPGEDCELRVR